MTTEQDRNDPRPVTALVGDLVQQITTLFRTESSLLRAELKENLSKVGSGVMEIAAGAILLLCALLVLLFALVELLENWMSPALAALIVGVVVAIIGAILVRRGTTNISPSELAPDRTAGQIRQDIQVAKEKV